MQNRQSQLLTQKMQRPLQNASDANGLRLADDSSSVPALYIAYVQLIRAFPSRWRAPAPLLHVADHFLRAAYRAKLCSLQDIYALYLPTSPTRLAFLSLHPHRRALPSISLPTQDAACLL